MIRLFPFALLAFKIWMLVDAIRRREPYYWLMIIFFIPGGSLIYLFMVKVQDFGLKDVAEWFRQPPTVDQLRAAYRRTSSPARLLELAEGLNAAGESAEAVTLFEEVLEGEPDNPDALFGLGQAYVGLGDYPKAIEVLSAFVESNRGFRDYAAWPLLAFALHESGQTESCLSMLRGLFETSPRLAHAVMLAHYLIRNGKQAEASELLTTAIDDHRAAPKFTRRRNFRSAWRAKRMLKACSVG